MIALHESTMSCQNLWDRMSPERRSRASYHFWNSADSVGHLERDRAKVAIAKARKSRESRIRRASSKELEKWTLMVPQFPEDVTSALIRTYLLNEQSEMIVTFLDGLRIPHVRGVISDDFNPTTLRMEELAEEAQRLIERYGEELVGLYLAYAATNVDGWGDA